MSKAADVNDTLLAEGKDAVRARHDRARRFNSSDEAREEKTNGQADKPAPALIQPSAQFVKDFVPPDYVVDGILQRGFVYSNTGRTGSGKTSIWMLIAAQVALGKAMGSCEVQKGRALVFAGENPDDARARWIAMSQHVEFDIDTIEVYFIPGVFKISEMAARIQQEARDHGPFALVVVDTSAAYFEGDDENDNVQQGVHARRLREKLTGLPGKPAVIVNCHPAKNAADDNLLPRGGGAFIAEMDGNLTTINRDGAAELHWQGKFRGPDFAPMLFQLKTVTHERLKDSKGRLVPTVIAAYLSQEAQEAIAAATRTKEDEVLAAIAANPKASLRDVARTLGWKLRSNEPNQMAVSRAVASLKKDKLVMMERGKPVLTGKGKRTAADVTAKHTETRASR
jgi:hypothetical protein